MSRSKKRACIDVIIAVVVLVAWIYMAVFGQGALSRKGLQSLQYFTVDSNLLMGASALACAFHEWRGMAEGLPLWLRNLRLAATTSVMLTFWVVILFLCPLWGFASMYRGANLPFHLLVPLAAIATFWSRRMARPLRPASSLWGVVPMLVYGAYYAGRVLAAGPEADFYGFLYLTGGSIGLALLLMIAVTFVLSVATWFVGGGRLRRRADEAL